MAELEDVLRFLKNDLQQIKISLDKYLKPYKDHTRYLEGENLSLRNDVRQARHETEVVLRFVKKHVPGKLEEAITTLVKPEKRGKNQFIANWKARLEGNGT